MSNNRAVIFDFDGVITDSFSTHIQTINEVFSIDNFEQEYKDSHNGNFYNGNLKISSLDWDIYKQHWIEKKMRHPITIDTTSFIKRILSDKHIISSGSEIHIKDSLAEVELFEEFEKILGLETSKSKVKKFNILAKDLDIAKSIFLTDTLGDILEAKEVRLPTIAVTFRFHDRETLERGNPEYIVDSWEEVEEILKERDFELS